jgi:hypothetical protein
MIPQPLTAAEFRSAKGRPKASKTAAPGEDNAILPTNPETIDLLADALAELASKIF